VRLFVRQAAKLGVLSSPSVDIVEGTTFDRGALNRAMAGVDAAYYLVHSMGSGGNFSALERRSAENFREAAIEAGVRRLVYLGGLGTKDTGSEHLRSRLETGEILSARPDLLPVLWFRAGTVIGSGSASFEMIRNLVAKLPVMTTPRWVKTRTQPIGIADVCAYLRAALDIEFRGSLQVDIGAEAMSFREMLLGAARVMGLRRHIIPVPLLSPRLSSYWLILMTPVPFVIAKALVEGLKSETVVLNDIAARLFPGIRPRRYEEAFAAALDEIERNQVVSRWCDSTAGAVCDIDGKDRDAIARAVYVDTRRRGFGEASAASVFKTVTSIGGRRGWLARDWLWRLRGLADKLVGGPGLNRGRRDAETLRIGDGLDFWKVLDLRENRRLLLLAQMKVPGKAWLEFAIEGDELVQTAYFLPKGLGGRLYWWAMKPFHALIFGRMIKRAVDIARTTSA
ncbi:MAG: SDR family oxidoreductase, partial [Candidatus Aminicenantes bacterium]|nr:SDR family oxidoreductase [Candidatus Aminicenantes bacterium]